MALKNAVVAGASGIGIGIIAGLAVSSVVNVLVAGLMTAAVGLVTVGNQVVLKWLRRQRPSQIMKLEFSSAVSPAIASLILGVVVGAMAGIWIRTHDYLGSNSTLTQVPQQKGDVSDKAGTPQPDFRAGGLFSGGSSACYAQQILTDDQLRSAAAEANPKLEAWLRDHRELDRGELEILADTFVCSQLPLSPAEYKNILSDPSQAALSHHALLRKLGEEIDRRELLESLIEGLFEPETQGVK